MNQENGKTGAAPVEMCRVRRIVDGWYLTAIPRSRGAMLLTWWGPTPCPNFIQEWNRGHASHIANAMIALSGDTGIEIEPV